MKNTTEDLLNDQLATCLAAMQDCLAQSRTPRENDTHGHLRRNDVHYVARLMKASARLTESLARLKGQTRHDIHVTRGDAAQGHVTRGDAAQGPVTRGDAARDVDKGGRGRKCGG